MNPPARSWQPSASLAVLRLRAALKARIRAYFAATQALEVDTPALSSAAQTDPHIAPLTTRLGVAPDATYFLHSSPEFPMKRLLAAGVGDCWQFARVFRDGERGRYHNPEFDLLEWYRVGADHHALMDDVEALLTAVVGPERAVPRARRLRYAEAFVTHAAVDPLTADAARLREAACDGGLEPVAGLADDDHCGWLDRILSGLVAPALAADTPTFLYDWPAEQGALARLDESDARVARRFELYWGELELANGFHELIDASEQRRRFEADQARRAHGGQDPLVMDERLLAALEAGLPDCAGVALGFDRLVMIAAGLEHIDQALAFPLEDA
ncbi:MAG: EF-P lysine aminoacylase EpmA [Halofilum sp. (in: g-proteobacteria)]